MQLYQQTFHQKKDERQQEDRSEKHIAVQKGANIHKLFNINALEKTDFIFLFLEILFTINSKATVMTQITIVHTEKQKVS